MSVHRLDIAIGSLAVISLVTFFATNADYIFLYILSMVGLVVYLVKKKLFLFAWILFLGNIPPMIEYFFSDFGQKAFVILGGIFVIIMLIVKYKKGENIW